MSAPTIDRSGHVEGAFITGVCAAVLSKVIDPAGPLGDQVRAYVANACSPAAAAEVARGLDAIHRAGDAWAEFVAASVDQSAQAPEIQNTRGSGHDPDDELTPDQAAGLLGIGPERVRQLLHSGALPGRKRGGRWLTTRMAVMTEAASRASMN